MYYRESEMIFKNACAYQANLVNNAMLAESRQATDDELIDCYTWITEGINEFTLVDIVGFINQWFAGIFQRQDGMSIMQRLRLFTAFDVRHNLLFEQDGVYRHNPAFDVSRMARA